jgi:hypothetical protein
MVLAVTTPDPLVEVLREVAGLLRGIRNDFALQRQARQPATMLSREDRPILAKLLPAIAGALGSEPFLARDLFVSNSAGLRLVLSESNSKRIGRLFGRAAGEAIGGYLVEDTGAMELNSILWRVVEVAEFPGNEKVLVPPRDRKGLP